MRIRELQVILNRFRVDHRFCPTVWCNRPLKINVSCGGTCWTAFFTDGAYTLVMCFGGVLTSLPPPFVLREAPISSVRWTKISILIAPEHLQELRILFQSVSYLIRHPLVQAYLPFGRSKREKFGECYLILLAIVSKLAN